MDFSSSTPSSDNTPSPEEQQQALVQGINAMVVQMLQGQTRKTCFDKCIAKNARFVDQLGKNEQICLAKCMDRMFESYSIVTKASAEMAQNLQSSLDQEDSSSSSFL
mmetsp:Transcript_8699/g.9749  ORF Transcript_8699/g.9749 Transcript_8699/m.9749 type:complete len:107 (-) Transcript_8699:134-454(-)